VQLGSVVSRSFFCFLAVVKLQADDDNDCKLTLQEMHHHKDVFYEGQAVREMAAFLWSMRLRRSDSTNVYSSETAILHYHDNFELI